MDCKTKPYWSLPKYDEKVHQQGKLSVDNTRPRGVHHQGTANTVSKIDSGISGYLL